MDNKNKKKSLRCDYTHNDFIVGKNEQKAFRHNGTNQCWMMDATNYGGKTRCLFHIDKNKESEQIKKKQAPTLKKLLKAWNATKSKNSFLMPGMRCGEIDLSELIFKSNIKFNDVIFTGDVFFNNSYFTSTVSFNKAIFEKSTEFNNVTFEKKSVFNDSTFNNSVEFNEAKFRGFAWFKNVDFIGGNTFNDAYFMSMAIFNNSNLSSTFFCNTKFNKGAEFNKVTFKQWAKFNRAKFIDKASFNHCKFDAITQFYKAEFNGSVEIKESDFLQNASFRKTIFQSKVKFDSSTFQSEAFFDGVQFRGKSSFIYVEFNTLADFNTSTYKHNAIFNNSIFQSKANFTCCNFIKIADFNKITFKGEAKFLGTIFESKASFQEVKFENVSEFNHALFYKEALFDKAIIKYGPYMSSCFFDSAPSFYDVNISQGATFRGSKFSDVKSEEAPSRYRTLKVAMNRISNKNQEANFYALEQESLLNQDDTPFTTKLLSRSYKKFSNYGQSFIKPLWYLLIVYLFFTFLYIKLKYTTVQIFIYTVLGAPNFLEKISVYIKFVTINIISPFKVWTNDYISQSFGSDISKAQEVSISIIASFQSIISLTLITLFILAIRRNFKLS